MAGQEETLCQERFILAIRKGIFCGKACKALEQAAQEKWWSHHPVGTSCGYGLMLMWISLSCEHMYTKKQFFGIVSSGMEKTPQAWIPSPECLTLPFGVF